MGLILSVGLGFETVILAAVKSGLGQGKDGNKQNHSQGERCW